MNAAAIGVCLALVGIATALGLGLGPSTHFAPTRAEVNSQDATVSARAGLELYFNALASGDAGAVRALSAPYTGPTDWSVHRLIVESITPQPGPGLLNSDPAFATRPSDYRSFSAPIRLWTDDQFNLSGERLDWVWNLQRVDGTWIVVSYGYP